MLMLATPNGLSLLGKGLFRLKNWPLSGTFRQFEGEPSTLCGSKMSFFSVGAGNCLPLGNADAG
jgi:hypothetical protein